MFLPMRPCRNRSNDCSFCCFIFFNSAVWLLVQWDKSRAGCDVDSSQVVLSSIVAINVCIYSVPAYAPCRNCSSDCSFGCFTVTNRAVWLFQLDQSRSGCVVDVSRVICSLVVAIGVRINSVLAYAPCRNRSYDVPSVVLWSQTVQCDCFS